jgi:hypothetical protein
MPYTIPESFARLRSNLEITGLQNETVSVRQQTIRRTMDNGVRVIDDFLTGSYARSTMISPLSEADIDVFTVVSADYWSQYGQNPKGLLDLAKRTLMRTYTSTPDISRNGQAVTIRFTDFVVDVVVGFNRQGGGYLIANAIGNHYLGTNPKQHVELMSEANRIHNGNLVPLIKMIKGWNKSHGSYFRSFHLEVLALQVLKGIRIDDFPSGMRFFFDKARQAVRYQSPDPAGFGDDVGRYITQGMVDEASKRFENAFNTAVRGEMLANRGDIRGAIDVWRILLPRHFPAYG